MSDHYYYEECGDMTAPEQLLYMGAGSKNSQRRDREQSRSQSRSRDRSKERRREKKERSRDKKRSRRRSRSRSRNRSHSRSRSRSHSGSRNRHRFSRKSRGYYDDESDSNESGRYWEESPPGYRNYDRYDSQRGIMKGKWDDGIPNNVILIRNLPLNSTEQDVRNIFNRHGTSVREVRLMRSRETGQSLRYCFVEFFSIPEAQYWMELNQGELRAEDNSTLYMYYSTTRRGNINNLTGSDTIDSMSDWVCNKCSCKNFQRRTFCRRCSHFREDTSKRMMMNSAGCSSSDGSDQIGSNACNTLILRGLDGLTTEESIQTAMKQFVSAKIVNCRVMRDPMTGVSNGYAFVELGSVKESKQIMQQLLDQDDPLEVDGKALFVDYAKNTFSTAISTFESDAQLNTTSYYEHSQQTYNNVQDITANQAAAVVQAAMLKTTQNRKATALILQQQQLHYKQQAAGSSSLLGPYVAPAAALASSAAVAATAATASTTSSSATAAVSTAATSSEYPRYPTPDTSKFTYDEPSGYYYDASTSFYYDAKSQYFYNTQKQHFMYWDGQQHTYIPVASAQQQQQQTISVESTVAKQKSESPEKVKMAKKIAKDMEKWAKKMNSQKESKKFSSDPQTQQQQSSSSSSSVAPDLCYSLLEKSSANSKNTLERLDDVYSNNASTEPPVASSAYARKDSPRTMTSLFDYESPTRQQQYEDQQQQQSSSTTMTSTSQASSGSNNNTYRSESDMIDWAKMTCLLCRRVFTTKETLVKHQQFSDLHKKNLEDYQKSRGEYSDEAQQYRDRARERREKFGESDPPPMKNRRHREEAERKYATETPTQNGIKEDNVGNRLLQKMGWKDGQGLGKAGQGIVNPIEATMRQSAAGLGSRGSSYNVNPSGSYHDRLKSTFRAYFDEIN